MSRLTKFLILAAALLLVGGGTATAAKLVTGKSVKNESLTGADLKNGSVGPKDLSSAAKKTLTGKNGAPGAAGPAGPQGAAGPAGPQGPAGTPDGYTKGQADETFARGDAEIGARILTRDANTLETTLMPVGDMGRLTATCGGGGVKTVDFVNEGFPPVDVMSSLNTENGTLEIDEFVVTANTEQAMQSSAEDFTITAQFVTNAADLSATNDFSTAIITAKDIGGQCRFRVQMIDNEDD